MQDATINLNQNAVECLQKIFSIGHTTVMNICNGSSTIVPWGSLDWLAFCGIGGLVLLFVLLLIAMLFSI